MTDQKIQKIIRNILLLISFTPLLFWGSFFYPFIIVKTVYFRVLIQIGFTLLVFLWLGNRQKNKFKMRPALWLLFVFLAINLVSAVFGYDFYRSFWSSFDRMEGIINLVYLVLYAVILASVLKDEKDWLLNRRAMITAGFLVSIYGLSQTLNLMPDFFNSRIKTGSTIGNVAFLSGYLLLLIGLSLYNYTRENNQKWKYFSLGAAILNIICLFLANNRGSMVGFVLAFLVYLLLDLLFSPKKHYKFTVPALLIIIAAGVFFYTHRSDFKHSRLPVLSRLANISLNDETTRNRLIAWRWGWDYFKSHPIIGAGLENYMVVFNYYYTPEISEKWFDRTHNIYLDQLVSNGLFGFLAYLALFVYALARIILRRKEDYHFFSIFFCLMVAYTVHNFFVFDALVTSFVFIFIFIFISQNKSTNETLAGRKTIVYDYFSPTFLLLSFASLLILYYVAYLPIKINRDVFRGYYYALADQGKSFAGFQAALDYRYGSAEGTHQLVDIYNLLLENPAISQSVVSEFFNLAKEKLKFAVEKNPYDVRVMLDYGNFIINGRIEDSYALAENILRRAVELSPGRPEADYLLFNLYLQEKEEKKAIAVLEACAKRLPWFFEPKLYLANSLIKLDPKKSAVYFNEAIKIPFDHTSANLLKVVAYLLSATDYQRALPYYQELVNLNPNNYDYHLDLAKIYYLLNKKPEARAELNIVKVNKPELLQNLPGMDDVL